MRTWPVAGGMARVILAIDADLFILCHKTGSQIVSENNTNCSRYSTVHNEHAYLSHSTSYRALSPQLDRDFPAPQEECKP